MSPWLLIVDAVVVANRDIAGQIAVNQDAALANRFCASTLRNCAVTGQGGLVLLVTALTLLRVDGAAAVSEGSPAERSKSPGAVAPRKSATGKGPTPLMTVSSGSCV